MKRIHCTGTLFYYDGPQIFEARDAIGGHYIAVMVPSDNLNEQYLVTGVVPEQLRQFRLGSLDLRTLLTNSDEEERYLATVITDLSDLELNPLGVSLLDSGFLPDDGFVLHDYPTEDFVLREARERNNLVLEFTVEPPETAREHRIRAYTLTGILHHMQTLVKHACTAERKENPSRYRFRQSDDDMMDVVIPAVAGSFRIVLEAATTPDLFGSNNLESALRRIDTLFEHTAEPQEVLIILRQIRGHLAGSYLKLLRLLVERETGLRYSWAEPKSEQSRQGRVSRAEAGSLVDALSNVTNLGSEPITLEGEFDRFDRTTGSWALLTDEGRRSGKVRDGEPSLDGLEVGGRYRFHCDEEIETIDVTGRESRTLYLNWHETV